MLVRIAFALNMFQNASSEWFRSTDLWVMGPARFRCATLLCRVYNAHEQFASFKNTLMCSLLQQPIIATNDRSVGCSLGIVTRTNVNRQKAQNRVY